MNDTILRCVSCKKEYSTDKIRYLCKCGDTLDVIHDLEKLKDLRLKELFEKRISLKKFPYSSGVWRYKELILNLKNKFIISRGEGNTNIYTSKQIGEFTGLDNIKLKHEGENPTGSFKDRGMTVGASVAKFFNVSIVACASTGNTSASMASYAAAGEMQSIVFIPKGKIAFGKLAQSLAYGAKTLQIEGNFDDAMKLVMEVCRKLNIYLLNSINPFRIEGQKAILFETLQQLDWCVPDWFVLPGGNLGNNSALSKGLMELKELDMIHKVPRIAVIQAHGANPLYKMFKNKDKFKPVENPDTIASAIKIGNPVSWKKSLRGIKWSNGVVEEVTDQEIMDAKAHIDKAGIGAEPASCSTVAGVKKLIKSGVIDKNEEVVCILTGNLMKDPDSVVNYHLGKLKGIHSTFANKPIKIKANLEAIRKVLYSPILVSD